MSQRRRVLAWKMSTVAAAVRMCIQSLHTYISYIGAVSTPVRASYRELITDLGSRRLNHIIRWILTLITGVGLISFGYISLQ